MAELNIIEKNDAVTIIRLNFTSEEERNEVYVMSGEILAEAGML